jgi:hypothetical protein
MGEAVRQGRWTAEIEGDFVVFLINARPSWRLVTSLRDLGGRSMQKMLDYLMERPEKGLLAYEQHGPFGVIVQYWRSFDHLEAFARDKDDPHLEVWRNYWKRVGKSTRTGIWHETFLVKAGQYEAIYGNMPPIGLGKAGAWSPSPRPGARASESAPESPADAILTAVRRKEAAWTS